MATTCRWLIVAAWLASAALGFWFFQLRDQRPFESERVTLFDATARAVSAEAWYQAHFTGTADAGHVSATVVHIFRTGCACNRFTEPHLARIVARYRQEGVRFVDVDENSKRQLQLWVERRYFQPASAAH